MADIAEPGLLEPEPAVAAGRVANNSHTPKRNLALLPVCPAGPREGPLK